MLFAPCAAAADTSTPQSVSVTTGAPPASGPTQTTGVEEVVVTARHRAEKAQTVPIALTSVGKASLNANGITSVNQLEQLVPTLQVTEFNPRNLSFNIRGIGNNVAIANDGLESGVGVYVDDVFYSRPAQAAFAFPDIDNVQVLRGPQGTLFGKNTTAGAVDVHTATPSFTPQATLEATAGNYGFWQTKGSVSDGFNDKIAASVAFVLGQRSGTETSAVTGQHYGSLDDKAVRVQVYALPTDNLTLRFIADYAHELENCCVLFPSGVFTHLANGTAIPYDWYQREAFTDYHVPNYDPFSRKAAIAEPTYYNMETGGAQLRADYDLSGFTLTSISAWRFWNFFPVNGAFDGIGLDVIHSSNAVDYQKQVTQEFRVTSPTGGAVDYTAGGFFLYQDIPGNLREGFGYQAGPFLAGPQLPKSLSTLLFNGLTVYDVSDAVTNSYAAYGQATWHVLPRFDLTGGLRYTYEDKSGSFDQYQFGAASLAAFPKGLQTILQSIRTGLGPPQYFDDHTHNGALSGLITASYKLTPTIYTYATVSRGDKSSGVNVTQLPPGFSAIIKPERVDDYEIGFKSAWLNNRLIFNADAFWIEDSDYQGISVAPIGEGTYTSFTASVPKVRSRGLEFDSHAKPANWLTLNLSGAYTDAIYESYPNGQCPPEVEGSSVLICNNTGKALPGTSRWAASMGGEITQPITEISRYKVIGYLGADFSIKSSFDVSAADSIYSKIAGYGLLNVRLGARTSDGAYDAFLWSHNATNTNYYLVRLAAQPFSGLVEGEPGDPLTFGGTIRVHF